MLGLRYYLGSLLVYVWQSRDHHNQLDNDNYHDHHWHFLIIAGLVLRARDRRVSGRWYVFFLYI